MNGFHTQGLETQGNYELSFIRLLSVPELTWEGVTIDPRYDVSGVPEFIANRIDNDTLELEVGNLDSRNIRVEKKPDEISSWAELATYTPDQFKVTVDISADPNPKLKAAFTVTGTIGGVTVNPKGRFSITNSIRKDG